MISKYCLVSFVLGALIQVASAQAQAVDNQLQVQAVREAIGNYEAENPELMDGAAGQAVRTLCNELLRLLESRSGTLLLGLPPHGPANAVTDFAIRTDGLGKYWAEWSYCNPGDYNFDGVVDYLDAISMSQDYGLTVDQIREKRQADGTAFASECDGDGDGVVSLADVGLVAQNYGNHIDYYRIMMSDDSRVWPWSTGMLFDWSVTELASVPVKGSLSEMDNSTVLRDYACELDLREHSYKIFPLAERIWVEPVAAVRGAYSLLLSGNALPALIHADQLCGAVPSTFSLSCYSDRPEGVAWQTAWDFDGDGIYGEPGLEAAARSEEGAAVVTLEEPCCRLVAARFSTGAEQYTATVPLAVYRVLPPAEAALAGKSAGPFAPGGAGFATIIRLPGGGSRLSYATGEAVADGTGPVEQVVVDYTGQVITSPVTTLIAGRPAMAYAVSHPGGETASIYWTRAVGTAGTGWSAPVLLSDHAVMSDERLGLAMMDFAGKPAVAYQRWQEIQADGSRGQELVFQAAQDAAGAGWREPVTLAAQTAEQVASAEIRTATLGWPIFLRLIGGKPSLLVRHRTPSEFYVALIQAQDGTGATWKAERYVATTSYIGNQSHPEILLDIGDWRGNPVLLSLKTAFHAPGGSWPRYSYHLILPGEQQILPYSVKTQTWSDSAGMQKGAVLEGYQVDLRDLPGLESEPFFGQRRDEEEFRLACLPQASEAGEPSLALVSLWAVPGNGIKLRAAYTGDGGKWKLTPEFDYGTYATAAHIRAANITCVPDQETQAPTSRLELLLDVQTADGPQVWFTCLPLR